MLTFGPEDQIRERFKQEIARGGDVWLISPDKIKHLPDGRTEDMKKPAEQVLSLRAYHNPPGVMATYQHLPCGCQVAGAGTISYPLRPVLCEKHAGTDGLLKGLQIHIDTFREEAKSQAVSGLLLQVAMIAAYAHQILANAYPENQDEHAMVEHGDENSEPTGSARYYVQRNSGDKVFVKEATFFKSQGGDKEEWGKAWTMLCAGSLEEARRLGEILLPAK